MPETGAITNVRLTATLLVAVAVGLVFLALFVRGFENKLIFHPPCRPEGFSQNASRLGVEEIWLRTSDGANLNGWYWGAPANSKVLLWFHGNADDVGNGLAQLPLMSRLGVNILEVDYRGYGKSTGQPDEDGVYRDADAAYEHLVQQRHFAPKDIYLYGHSLGGAVAVELASRRECGGLIVHSSFTSLREMARCRFKIPFVEYLPRSRFDSLAKIKQVRAPVLIFHGTRDEVVPYDMGRRLFDAASPPKWFFAVEGATHNDALEMGGEHLVTLVRKFLEGTLAPAGS